MVFTPVSQKFKSLRFCDSINRWPPPPWWYLPLFLKNLKVCVSVTLLTTGSRLLMVFILVYQKFKICVSVTVLTTGCYKIDGIYPCFSKITVAVITPGSHQTDPIWHCFSKIFFTSFVTRYFSCFSELRFESSNRKMFINFNFVWYNIKTLKFVPLEIKY